MSEPTDGSDAAQAEQAAAAAAVSYLQAEDDQANLSNSNKWSKNGFGAPVATKQSGKFTKSESEMVRKAIEEFCSAKQISVARLCSECDHKAELKGAWMEIAKCLPHRSVQSVYRHGIRRCHPFKRGAWTEGETALLTDLVQRMGKKWSAIQTKLNRSADSCRDKYREMSDDFVKGRWREQETELLKRYIRDHLDVDPTTDMKELGKQVEQQGIQIPWSTISKRMGKRSRLSCFKKWQKMTGTFSTADDYGKKPEDIPEGDEPDMKRAKLHHPDDASDYDVYNSAKMAAETVEAVELPDTDTLVPSVREI